MTGWIEITHPITGELIKCVPTGKTKDGTAECQVITPNSNLDKVWIKRDDILKS